MTTTPKDDIQQAERKAFDDWVSETSGFSEHEIELCWAAWQARSALTHTSKDPKGQNLCDLREATETLRACINMHLNRFNGTDKLNVEHVLWQERQSRTVNSTTGEITGWTGWYNSEGPSPNYEPPVDPRFEVTYQWRKLYTHVPDDTALIQRTLDALESAKAGLQWYQDMNPEQTSGTDDEANAELDDVISELHKRLGY